MTDPGIAYLIGVGYGMFMGIVVSIATWFAYLLSHGH